MAFIGDFQCPLKIRLQIKSIVVAVVAQNLHKKCKIDQNSKEAYQLSQLYLPPQGEVCMKGCDKCHPWAPKSLDDSLLKDLKFVDSFHLHLFVDASQTALPPRGPAGQGDPLGILAMAMARTAIFMMLRTNGDFKLL